MVVNRPAPFIPLAIGKVDLLVDRSQKRSSLHAGLVSLNWLEFFNKFHHDS